MLFGRINNLWKSGRGVQDSGGSGETIQTPPTFQGECKEDELKSRPELYMPGQYIGFVESYEYGSTKFGGSSYVKLKVRIQLDRLEPTHIFVYWVFSPSQMPFIRFTAPLLISRKVCVRIDVVPIRDIVYNSAQILEVF